MNRLIFIIPMIRVAWSHDKFTHVYYEQAIGANMENISWDPELNGRDDTYMAFTAQWKKEIILWAKDCIFDIKNSMNQLDQINWNAQDDPRHVYGITMGRMLEMHRQQMDMYRRMKRVVENKFTWLRPEISGYYPQLSGQNGVVEPGNGSFDPLEYGREWAKGGKKTFFDYKPHVYIMALEYITKRGIEIEHLVKRPANKAQEILEGKKISKKTESKKKKKHLRQKCVKSIIKNINITINEYQE
ncbi:uncharacterized protein LOC125239467 isoform X2 [Leguminivora glycinivorella]|uniref:uncharacterized protein LOC125239467 isoform X2 n=1 Tax=Leguminivora glycinivorella TaxID=1035111 RepID=UPI00200E5FAC|nr:uncharacterized protein LOC125239467 isoform X2 [Leguminivora glycinivorella]